LRNQEDLDYKPKQQQDSDCCSQASFQRGLAFTDDAAVLTALFGLTAHIKPVHRAAAARALGKDIMTTGD
jgi:hypothetical protein